MLGVVLWSNVSDRKAVIWCEDQGDLAYVNGSDSASWPEAFFDAGDLVQFDIDDSCSMRVANNPKLVLEKAVSALPDLLRQGVQEVEPPEEHSCVLHFAPVTVENHSGG